MAQDLKENPIYEEIVKSMTEDKEFWTIKPNFDNKFSSFSSPDKSF